ncbi:phenylacetate--CoA ligase family protein [Micromonospora yangpuensis]|uniref:Phenylacetate-CoA ligase n=1 Tax=Micromonospora yangpuensis TaxID=683228 RepID=A0A1C6UP87_9ACTN|nr:AMP-binding protein [Micromonospora yangpuensis]GGM08591.1 phenylacetate--CoA ligase [Micromonospora yangpuensis]SCL55832.1 phenylacetate-CoA ligase [Micromonospora yangpuensis]
MPVHSTLDLSGDSLLYADPAEVQRLRDPLVAEQVQLLARHHPYYRQVLAGGDPGQVRGVADLDRLPVTGKQDFLADPEAFRLAPPDRLPVEERTLAYLIYTTGTTSGAPAPLYITTSDDWAYLLHARRCARMLGLESTDVIANLFPLTPFPMGARIRADRTAAAVGASIFQGHTGRGSAAWPVHRRLDEAIDLVLAHRATVLWGVAGFVRRVLIRAAERQLRLPSVRWCFVTGEATSDAGLDDLRARLSAVGAPQARVANRYGSTEGWSMIACADGHGWHNPTPELVHLAVVDPVTHQPLPDGETGLLLISHLRARGTAFLRYAVGDLVALTRQTCPSCGRTAERIVSQPVRTKDLVKVNGTLVNLGVLGDALVDLPGVAEYRVILDHRKPGDTFSGDGILVEFAPVAGADPDPVASAVRERIRELAHLTPQVRVAAADEIYDPAADAKPRRLIDRRPTG